jgi:hypothetical protein
MRRIVSIGLAAAVTTVTALASAETGPPDASGQPTRRDKIGFLGGPKVGVVGNFSGLSPWGLFAVELGVVLPVAHRSLAIAVDLDYSQPTRSSSEMDARVMGGTYNWHLTEQELGVMPLAMWRFTMLGRATPYLGVGPRIYLLKSTVGWPQTMMPPPNFQNTTEQSAKVGFGIPFGCEVQFGPGGFIGELLYQYLPIDHVATSAPQGAVKSSSLSFSIGYRFLP